MTLVPLNGGEPEMILVTGATGNVGAEVVRALAAAGESVRALVRDTESVTLPDGVEAVAGDLSQPESLAPALDGAEAMFLLPGYPGVFGVAERAGVERAALLSSPSAQSRDLTNAVARYMVESEDAAAASALSTVVIRSSGFMSNTLQWIPQLHEGDVVRAPFADVPVAMIDPYDIAAVIALVLVDGDHAGRTYWVTGPEALRPEDRVRRLTDILGRPLRFDAQSDDDAWAEMTASMPSEYVEAFFDFYARGALDESPVLPTVREVTGREPRTFDAWATMHAGAFG
ncbi:NmrA family NAD(P)-binding protein [Solicola gregarius]|uniref:NAD(P)H-binding protein n=1 Tax=Solicola gregarius TaxID=2908642 RepID=A0AA46TKZ3_9ACTN|nr:NmrA family NAD(P)-binding protein [Solicola gregarius]UYM07216.1 NAD(P)H-binding protein [Solicola gregarius]